MKCVREWGWVTSPYRQPLSAVREGALASRPRLSLFALFV